MAEETSFGVRRLRQAITNQATCGSGQFELSIDSADKLCHEIEDELAQLSWAEGVLAPVDADGNVVPLGTEKLYTDDGEMVRVESICYGAHLWNVRRMYSDKTYWLDALHLAPQDSWEKLERDVFALVVALRIKDPGGDVRKCINRAKALAKRDAKEASRG